MDQTTFQNTILTYLYEAYFVGNQIYHLDTVREEMGLNAAIFGKLISPMEHDNLIKAMSGNWGYMITERGILYAESNSIVPDAQSKNNDRIRTLVLKMLAKLYDESDNQFANYHINEVASILELDSEVVASNIFFLDGLQLVESFSMGSYMITHEGLRVVGELRYREEIASEFENLAELEPQPRGRAFQKLVAKVIGSQGWSQEEGVRTSNEEIDVVIHKDREYYLAECKWEKKPIEADVVRELFGKLSIRIGVQGMLISISGFTSGAVKAAEEYASSKVIILFGPVDTHSLICGEATFESLLNAKYMQIATRRKAEYS